jgi:hypothetical protein
MATKLLAVISKHCNIMVATNNVNTLLKKILANLMPIGTNDHCEEAPVKQKQLDRNLFVQKL